MEIKKLKDRLHMLTTTHKDDVMSDNRNLESDLNLDNDNLNEVFRKLKDVLRFQFQSQEDFSESSKYLLIECKILYTSIQGNVSLGSMNII